MIQIANEGLFETGFPDRARRLGMITIGQAPRADVAPILEEALGAGIRLVQVGALDGVEETDIRKRLQPEDGEDDHLLTSRLANGRSAVFSRNKIRPLVQRKIDELEDAGIKQILLLCTGAFPGLTTRSALLYEPDRLLPPLLKALAGERRFGVVGPLAEQADSLRSKYGPYGLDPKYAAASPYEPDREAFRRAAAELRGEVDLIVLDCMGYTREMRSWIAEGSDVPVVLSNAMIGKVLSETV
ncbi:AroM protein [Saccharibacillus sp. O23]|uniref:AroM family protein n=1 Tax=Saccharibacillus sp. O23 TaxID=2009338 RepID=UPI000B4E00C2|nr:AroM family protein [Saccharibacillus sp. O23]OWR31514.1 AroM protein [Saccharibacillus sp. O23]